MGILPDPGELKGLGHRVAPSTIAKVLNENGILPAPDRPSSWRSFLEAHWCEIAGIDFFTTEVWTVRGLVTYYVLFVIDLRTRRVHLAGMTPNPGESFMAQVARNLTDAADGFLANHRFLICDRDAKFTARFRLTLEDAGRAGDPDSAIKLPIATPIRRAIRTLHQVGVPAPHDLLRRVVSCVMQSTRTLTITTPERSPSGDRQRGHRPWNRLSRRGDPLPREPGWPPQALPPSGVMMEMLNRSAVIVKPRQDDTEGLAERVFKTLHEEPTVYLLPEYEDSRSQREVLEEFWPRLFEALLEGWITDEGYRPKYRTFEMFHEWFEVHMSSIVGDPFLDEPLEYIDQGGVLPLHRLCDRSSAEFSDRTRNGAQGRNRTSDTRIFRPLTCPTQDQ